MESRQPAGNQPPGENQEANLPTFKQFKLPESNIEVVFKMFANSTAMMWISEEACAADGSDAKMQRFGSVLQVTK